MRRATWFGLVTLLSTAPAGGASRTFFDDFESGNTLLWDQDFIGNTPRPRCMVVTTAVDGVKGPFAGARMASCNAPTGDSDWETLKIKPFVIGDEVFYRYRVRADLDHDDTFGSTHKIGRIFHYHGDTNQYVDIMSMFGPVESNQGMYNDLLVDGERANGVNYWGDAMGDNTADPSGWHTVEYYCRRSTGLCRVWHDDIMVRNYTFGPIVGGLGNDAEFFLTSNWGDAHDLNNHVYFDNVEIFTDLGTGAVGSMADGTIAVSPDPVAPAAPMNLMIN